MGAVVVVFMTLGAPQILLVPENLYKLVKEAPVVPCLGGSAPFLSAPWMPSLPQQAYPVFSVWLFANELSHHPLSWQIQALVQRASGPCCPATLPGFYFMPGSPSVAEPQDRSPTCPMGLHHATPSLPLATNSSQGFLRNGFEIQSRSQVCLEWCSTSSILGQIWI